MTVRRTVVGIAATTLAVGATALFAAPAFAADPTPIQLDLAGLSSTSCPVHLPIANTIALPTGTKVSFQKGLLSGVLTLAAAETLTITPLNAQGVAGTPLVKDRAVPYAPATALAKGKYKLDWTALNLLGAVQGKQTGTLIIADGATAKCDLAVSVPTPQVSVPGLDPVTSAVNGAIGGVVSTVNSAVAPVNSAINQVGSAVPSVPGLPGGPSATPTSPNPKPSVSAPAGTGFSYTPWKPGPADLVVPDGYGSGSGLAAGYVPGDNGYVPPNFASGGAAPKPAAASNGADSPALAPTKSDEKVDLAANRSRGILDTLSGVFVVLAFAALSGAIAYYARNFLLGGAGKFH